MDNSKTPMNHIVKDRLHRNKFHSKQDKINMDNTRRNDDRDKHHRSVIAGIEKNTGGLHK